MRLAVIVYGSMWKMSSSASALEADVGERARARLGARGGTSQRKRPQLMDLKNGWDLISSAPFNAPRRAVASRRKSLETQSLKSSLIGTSVAASRGYGTSDDVADPKSLVSRARKYTHGSALGEVLGMGSGSLARGKHGDLGRPVRLLKAQYLVRLWEGGLPLPPRQAIEDEHSAEYAPRASKRADLTYP